ncbi:hypothetical protein [Streptomyces californicus]
MSTGDVRARPYRTGELVPSLSALVAGAPRWTYIAQVYPQDFGG